MDTFICPNKCCILRIKPYINTGERPKRYRKKAGIFIVDPETGKILIVQSKGRLWGIPKGTMEAGETEKQCAIRELKEETGIIIPYDTHCKFTRIKTNATYYYKEMKECKATISEGECNDVNAIGWIKPECLGKCIENGNITVTHHCRVIIERFLDYKLPHSNFIKIKRKQ